MIFSWWDLAIICGVIFVTAAGTTILIELWKERRGS
jgi:hypothetical protein